MIEKLIRCTKCNKVIPTGKILGSGNDSQPLPGVEWSEADSSAKQEFFRVHREHPMEVLRVDHDSIVSDKPDCEPVRTTFFQASNGQQTFGIKRSKMSLDSPAVYELVSVLDWNPELVAACLVLSS